jgi:hypothetical protein
MYWLFLAFTSDFPRVLPLEALAGIPFPLDVLAEIFSSLLAPPVVLHLIPVAAALWLVVRSGSMYLTDLFELESPSIARRYLLGAIFGLAYPRARIDRGDVHHLDRSNPVIRIGGPGRLQVHLGFAAVFETPTGLPRVYGPDRNAQLAGFERLRAVIDLRDQLRRVDEVRTVTRDGIEVFARDAQMMFRVYGGRRARSLEQPYPYTDASIRRLAYGQPVSDRGPRRWTESLPWLVRHELARFVGHLTFDQLLALEPQEVSATAEGRPLGGNRINIPRRELTEQFHTRQVRSRLQEWGLELEWMGVGTWEIRLPPVDVSDTSQPAVLAAWRKARSAAALSHQAPDRQLLELAGKELRALMNEWQLARPEGQQACRRLLTWYSRFFEQARRSALRAGKALNLPGYESMLDHLSRQSAPSAGGETTP